MTFLIFLVIAVLATFLVSILQSVSTNEQTKKYSKRTLLIGMALLVILIALAIWGEIQSVRN